MQQFSYIDENGEPSYGSAKWKRKKRPTKYEFIGWGSKQLINFLQAIGKDTSTQISRYEVADIINSYAIENKLQHPLKKKRIVCDQKLLSIFGRKTISRIKVYKLLESHYEENQDDSDYGLSFSSDEELSKSLCSERNAYQKRRVKCVPKSCWAAIIDENMKLLYLKRSLIQELAKESDIFEDKIVGSFVRIKSDPNDYMQKNLYQLAQVIGIKKDSNAEDVLLEVSNHINDVRVSMLSDDDFSKDECEDLRNRIKDGMLKRPTVVEFQEKSRALHEDITRHWLARELVSLKRKIDWANEKGWRKELLEYLERRELLQKPDEQSRLLYEVPKVIAEELDPLDQKEDTKDSELQCSSLLVQNPMGLSEKINIDHNGTSTNWIDEGNADGVGVPNSKQEIDWYCVSRESNPGQSKTFGNLSEKEVIVLSDDEEHEDQDGNHQNHQGNDHDIKQLMWHYRDPYGVIQGPFSLISMKMWSDAGYFDPDFKVWKRGQSHDETQLLADLLNRIFPS